MNTLTKVLIVIILGFITVACSGGDSSGSLDIDTTASTNESGDTTTSVTATGSESTTTDQTDTTQQFTSVEGMGVKGPLIDTIVTVYKVDTTAPDFKGEVVAEGVTDSNATLLLDINTQYLSEPLFIIEYTNGTELNGSPSVLPTLRTVATSEQLVDGVPIYATPLTTLAIDYAIESADLIDNPNLIENNRDGLTGNNDGIVTIDEFTAAIDSATRYVKGSFGLDILTDQIDLFTSAPILTSTTDQDNSLAYRTSIEVFAAVLNNVRTQAETNGNTVDAATLIQAVAKDMVDGTIDGQQTGQVINEFSQISTIELQNLFTVDPSTLNIPGTQTPISELDTVLTTETEQLAIDVTLKTLAQLEPSPIDVVYGTSTTETTTATTDTESTTDTGSTTDTTSGTETSTTTETATTTESTTETGTTTETASTTDTDTTTDTESTTDTSTTTETESTATAPQPTSTTVTLSWTVPSARENGDPLATTDIAGYEIYYFKDGTAPGDGEVISVPAMQNNSLVTQHSLVISESGTWIFAIASIDNDGLYSEISASVSAVIP